VASVLQGVENQFEADWHDPLTTAEEVWSKTNRHSSYLGLSPANLNYQRDPPNNCRKELPQFLLPTGRPPTPWVCRRSFQNVTWKKRSF